MLFPSGKVVHRTFLVKWRKPTLRCTHLLWPIILVGEAVAEASLAAHVGLFIHFLFAVRVQEHGTAAGGGHFTSSPPEHTHEKIIAIICTFLPSRAATNDYFHNRLIR